jgi:hypothetical protein
MNGNILFTPNYPSVLFTRDTGHSQICIVLDVGTSHLISQGRNNSPKCAKSLAPLTGNQCNYNSNQITEDHRSLLMYNHVSFIVGTLRSTDYSIKKTRICQLAVHC